MIKCYKCSNQPWINFDIIKRAEYDREDLGYTCRGCRDFSNFSDKSILVNKNYKTTTTITPSLKDGILSFENITDGLFKQYSKDIIDFKNGAVRKALIDLGWTPPEEIFIEMKGVSCNRECGLRTCYPLCKNNKCEYLQLDKPIEESKNLYGCDNPIGKQSLDHNKRFFDPK